MKFLNLFYIYMYAIYLNKNWKIYWSEQSFTGLEPEDRCSSWGLRIGIPLAEILSTRLDESRNQHIELILCLVKSFKILDFYNGGPRQIFSEMSSDLDSSNWIADKDISPWNENWNLLVRMKFLNLFYIYMCGIYLNKNWKIYWSEQSFTGLGTEDRCSSWGQLWFDSTN